MVTTTNQLLSELHQTSSKLAEAVDQIIGQIESNNYLDVDNDSHDLQGQVRDSIDRFASNQSINLIPSNGSGACHQICICEAFGKWNAKNGFTGIVKQAINYWLGCFQSNKTTIIFTSAWDQDAFEDKYEQAFDNYSLGGPHNIAVILVTPKDLSLVYSI